MGSRWIISGIELPEPPAADNKRINRTFQSENIYKFYPQLQKATATAYDYIMTGRIYPAILAFQLQQLAKSADTEVIFVSSPGDFNNNWIADGLYAFKQFDIKRGPTPKFVEFEGEITQVIDYVMTLTQFADTGDNQDTIEGSTESDEDGLGEGDWSQLIPELSSESFDLSRYDPIKIMTDLGLFPAL